ncbi:hypothetical protein C9374_004008 [Naegleria lovaniensis]|uniref:Uncharacterized protein n=1 Tax=Naegleria lovaniensis TaxID=51637 RepID=A0AA88H124_NAELO|nr:uncharacterized protein C9374_004008 [Naegleria lovaniensis]KAG2394244.1 hypothetical protein C9374_004008 [Naegleria lovaniensis]
MSSTSDHHDGSIPSLRELLFESSNGSLFIHEIVPYLNLNFLLNTMFFISKDVARLVQQQNHHPFVVNLRKITNNKALEKTKQQKKKKTHMPCSKIRSMIHFANGLKVETPFNSKVENQMMENVNVILERVVDNKKELFISIHLPSIYMQDDIVNNLLNGVAETCKKSTSIITTLSLYEACYCKPNILKPFSNTHVKHLRLYNCRRIDLCSILESHLDFDQLTVVGPFSVPELMDIYKLKELERKKITVHSTSSIILAGREIEKIFPIMDHTEFSSMKIYVDDSPFISPLRLKTKNIELESNYSSKICIPKVVSNNCEVVTFSKIRSLTFTRPSYTTLDVLPNFFSLKRLSFSGCHVTLRHDHEENWQFYMPNLTFLSLKNCSFMFEEENGNAIPNNPLFISLLQIPNATNVQLIEMGLKEVPILNTSQLSTLSLEGNPIDDNTWNSSTVFQFSTLKRLELRKTKFKYFKTLEPLFDKFEHLDLSNIPLTDIIVSLNGRVKLFSPDFLLESERNKYFETSTPFFNGSDRDIYLSLKNILSMDQYKHFLSHELPSVEFIGNPKKKSHPHTLDTTNVIFWNVLYSNNAARGNTPRIGSAIIDYLSNATQFAIRLTPSLTTYNYGQEWIFIACCYRNNILQNVLRLDSIIMEKHIPNILTNWSYISSHRTAVQQLREKYNIKAISSDIK